MKIKSNDAFSKIKDRWEDIKKQWIGGDNKLTHSLNHSSASFLFVSEINSLPYFLL
jgi:hypothetical protein